MRLQQVVAEDTNADQHGSLGPPTNIEWHILGLTIYTQILGEYLLNSHGSRHHFSGIGVKIKVTV